MEFKVGDKLRFISVSVEYYTQGDVYEIIDHDEGNDLYTLKFDDGVDFWHTKDVRECFQHIDEPHPQVTKVVLTQEQAEALERLKSITYNNSELILEYNDVLTSLSALSAEKFSAALLIGYEAEQTPEEKVLSELQAAFTDEDYGEVEYTCYTDGVRMVLNAYGIKVKGINDND